MTEQRDNPYAAPQAASPTAESQDSDPLVRPMSKTILQWVLVCSVSALPSLVLGFAVSQQIWAIPVMLLGIGLFVAGYCYVSRHPFCARLMSNQSLALCIRIAFSIRVVVSIIFPLGGLNDMWVGFGSVSLTQLVVFGHPMDGGMSLIAVFVTTIIQGIALNLEVYLLALVLFAGANLFKPEFQRKSSVR